MLAHGGAGFLECEPSKGRSKRLTMRIAFAVFLLTSAACAPSVPVVPENQQVSYSDHLEPIIITRCLGCHSDEKPEEDLVVEQGRGYAQLVGRASEQMPSLQLVVPGDVDASYLWQKVNHTASRGKGMPRTLTGSKRLPDPELELIRRWIEDGALP